MVTAIMPTSKSTESSSSPEEISHSWGQAGDGMGAPQTLGSQWCRELSSPDWEILSATELQKGAIPRGPQHGALPQTKLVSHAQDPLPLLF